MIERRPRPRPSNAGPRPRRPDVLRRGADVRGRRPRAHAGPVPVVRGHGRQPRRRHRRQVRRRRPEDRARVPQALTDYIKGRAGLRLQRARPGREHPHRLRPGRDHRPVLHPRHRPRTTSPSSSELKALGVDQFAGYLQHDNKEETLRAYGETIIPALREHCRRRARESPAQAGSGSACSGLVLIAAVWELYKSVGPPPGCWSAARAMLPRTSDRAMPHVWIWSPGSSTRGRVAPASRSGTPSGHACLFSLRIAAIGWLLGVGRRSRPGPASCNGFAAGRGRRPAVDRAQPDRAADRDRAAGSALGIAAPASAASRGTARTRWRSSPHTWRSSRSPSARCAG